MFISALIYRPANKDLYPHLLPWTVSYIMCSYRDWQPLTLPDSFSLHASWLLIRGRVSTTQTRGETLLRWQCGQGIWHEQMLPVTRRGTLLELVYLPTGASHLSLLASTKGAECNVEITQLCCVSRAESLWRRLRRVLPFTDA